MYQYPQRSQSLSQEMSGRRRTKNRSTGVCMMDKPSQPIPRNVKDIVASLRAAVQVFGKWDVLQDAAKLGCGHK